MKNGRADAIRPGSFHRHFPKTKTTHLDEPDLAVPQAAVEVGDVEDVHALLLVGPVLGAAGVRRGRRRVEVPCCNAEDEEGEDREAPRGGRGGEEAVSGHRRREGNVAGGRDRGR